MSSAGPGPEHGGVVASGRFYRPGDELTSVEQAIPQEISPGVYQCPSPIPNAPLRAINTYLIVDHGEVMLVDCGWNTPLALDFLEAYLHRLGLGFRDVRTIVVTHLHPDHYGLAGKVQELTGATLLLHRSEIQHLGARYERVDSLLDEMAEWLRVNGVPDDQMATIQRSSLDILRWVSPSRPEALVGGETIRVGRRDFEVIWTPGHTSGHICLYEPATALLFTGDHVLPRISPNISLHPQYVGNPLADFLDSLKVVRRLSTEAVLPGHLDSFREVAPRAAELIHHHEGRIGEILDALGQVECTAFEAASRMTWANGRFTWQDLQPFQQRMALLEVVAHLELMRSRGSADREVRGNLVLYRRAGSGPEPAGA